MTQVPLKFNPNLGQFSDWNELWAFEPNGVQITGVRPVLDYYLGSFSGQSLAWPRMPTGLINGPSRYLLPVASAAGSATVSARALRWTRVREKLSAQDFEKAYPEYQVIDAAKLPTPSNLKIAGSHRAVDLSQDLMAWEAWTTFFMMKGGLVKARPSRKNPQQKKFSYELNSVRVFASLETRKARIFAEIGPDQKAIRATKVTVLKPALKIQKVSGRDNVYRLQIASLNPVEVTVIPAGNKSPRDYLRELGKVLGDIPYIKGLTNGVKAEKPASLLIVPPAGAAKYGFNPHMAGGYRTSGKKGNTLWINAVTQRGYQSWTENHGDTIRHEFGHSLSDRGIPNYDHHSWDTLFTRRLSALMLLDLRFIPLPQFKKIIERDLELKILKRNPQINQQRIAKLEKRLANQLKADHIPSDYAILGHQPFYRGVEGRYSWEYTAEWLESLYKAVAQPNAVPMEQRRHPFYLWLRRYHLAQKYGLAKVAGVSRKAYQNLSASSFKSLDVDWSKTRPYRRAMAQVRPQLLAMVDARLGQKITAEEKRWLLEHKVRILEFSNDPKDRSLILKTLQTLYPLIPTGEKYKRIDYFIAIGRVDVEQGKIEKAIGHLSQKGSYVSVRAALGWAHLQAYHKKQGNERYIHLDAAVYYLEYSVKGAKKFKLHPVEVVKTLKDLGDAYFAQGQYGQAAKTYRRMLKTARGIERPEVFGYSLGEYRRDLRSVRRRLGELEGRLD